MKKGTQVASGVSLVTVVAVLGLNWGEWITPLVEPDYQLPDSIMRVQLTPGEQGLGQRTLSWVSGCDQSDYRVEVEGVSSGLSAVRHQVIPTHGGTTHTHQVTLPSLSPGSYPYSIASPDGSALYRDTLVIPSDTLPLTFVLLGDVQDTWGDDTKPLMDSLYRAYPDAVAWIQVGDLIERPHDQYWRRYYEAFSTVAPRIPLLTVIGDHENEAGLMYDIDDRWKYAFPYPANGAEERVGYSYYIDYPHLRVVCYDSNSLGWSIGTQRRWLEQVLGEREDDPFLLVCAHHPIYSATKSRYNLLNRTLLGPLFRAKGVDLVLAGHDHLFVHDRDEDGAGPHYLGLSTAHKTYPVQDPSRHVASESGARYYGVLTVSPTQMIVRVYREGGALLDTIRMER